MRSVAIFLLPVLLSGCGKDKAKPDDESHAELAAPGSDGVPTRYSNGHPLLTSTGDPVVLTRESQIVTLVNDHRIARGINVLIGTDRLPELARGHSTHMITHQFFGHVNPEGDTLYNRLNSARISWTEAGENIAAGYSTARDAYEAWIRSPTHLANIENGGWTHSDVGYACDAGAIYQHYWTQEFIRE